jgi:glycosyltransferase involved in cell wall biosynthesis
MTKIVRIITRLNIGGPAIHVTLLSSSLSGNGYEDILLIGSEGPSEGSMKQFAEDKGVRLFRIPEMSREISPLNDFKAFMRILHIMRREKPDIVHTHTAKAGTLGRLAAICAGIPIRVHTFHGHIFDGYFSPAKARIFLMIEKTLAFFTDKVVVVSQSVKDEITDKLKVTSRNKCAVIPLGFELDKFLDCDMLKGDLRKEYGLSGKTFLVGIVGRLVPIKNHMMFFDMARMLIDVCKIEDIRFIVVGGGELAEELRKYVVKSKLEKYVIFTGWRQDLPRVYADLDVVTMTSLNEGTPVSLIEAMACGRAIVATDVGGVRDILDEEETGLLVQSGDTAGFAGKVASLLRDEHKRAEFGARGRKSAVKKYSKERLIGDIRALYEELLAAKR